MGTNARPRKRRKTTQSFRALLTLVIAFVVAFAVPTTVAIASEDGSDSSPGTSQTATTDDSTTSATTSTSTPTPTADPPDSSADDQSEGGASRDSESVDTGQEDSGGGDSTAADPSASDQEQGDSQSVVVQQESDTSTSASTTTSDNSAPSSISVTQYCGENGAVLQIHVDHKQFNSDYVRVVPRGPNGNIEAVSFSPVSQGQTLTYTVPATTIDARVEIGTDEGQFYPQTVTINSCNAPVDSDEDGVNDDQDQCPNTPAGTTVDANGCPVVVPPVDSDGDGVSDDQDQCPDTPTGTTVDEHGCPVVVPPADSDGDGVSDDKDKCADTPAGSTVDADGCADSQKDSDGDGVSDDKDKCPGTAPGFTVDANGCIVCPPGTQPIHAEGDDIVNDCRPVVTTPPNTPTTAPSGPTTPVQPTGSPSPTASPQPTGTPGGPTNQQPTGNPGPVIIDVPAAPAIDDPAGPGNATWVVPVNTSVLIWTASADHRYLSVSVVDETKFVFAEGSSHDYGLACDSEGEAAPVATPANAGNPTPQPTANGGEGLRMSSSDGQTVRTLGILCGIVALVIGVALTVRRRYIGLHK